MAVEIMSLDLFFFFLSKNRKWTSNSDFIQKEDVIEETQFKRENNMKQV